MSKCEIIWNAVPVGPYSYSACRSVAHCNTHHMHDFSAIASENLQCPIGQIEEATEKAIVEIKAAKAAD